FAKNEEPAVETLRRMTAGEVEGATELQLTRKDGSTLWSQARVHTLAAGGGARRIVLHDVTRERLAEQRQAAVQEKVEQSQRLETMGLLVGGMTHDVNNMLTVILAVSSSLEHQLPPASTAKGLVREISDSALKASTLTRRLLSVRGNERSESVDVNRLL